MEWINVKDKLPEEGQNVFCWCGCIIHLSEDELTPPTTYITCPKCGFTINYICSRNNPTYNQLLHFKEYWDGLYGQGLKIANWHLNGELEPFDNFYDAAMEELNK